MKVLVTGSSGLIGKQLISFLAQKKINVIGYDRNYSESSPSGYTFEQGELEDFPRIASVIKKHEIDAIIHGGGVSHPIVGGGSPNQVIKTNILGTNNIYEAARLFGIKKIIYLSSGAVYGNNKATLLNEEEKPTPTTIYGVTKTTGESLAQVYTEKNILEIISLRLAFVYGPGRYMPDPIKLLIQIAERGEDINEEKGMDQKLEFIYVKDVVRAIWLALESKGLEGEVFNIGTGYLASMKEIINIIQDIYPHLSISMGPGDMGYDEMGSFDCSKAQKILKFEPLYSLKEGILEYANSFVNESKSR